MSVQLVRYKELTVRSSVQLFNHGWRHTYLSCQ